MRKKEGFVLREVCDEKVIIGEGLEAIDFGKMISMNETAAWLWENADNDFTAESLTAKMCKEYDIDEERAHNDIAKLLEQWKEAGIIE